MSYHTLDDRTKEIAERVLTRKQLDVFKLWCAGAGADRIGFMLGVSRSTVRGHLSSAFRKIELELGKDAA